MKNDHLPIYGVGPFYAVGIMIVSVMAIIISYLGILDFGKFTITKIPFTILGILIFVCGFKVWFEGAFKIDKYIINNKLCTDGIYSIVRNPCYSGIMLMCTGILLINNNLCLLILPVLYWIVMTILMKNTEEKWLIKLYGKEYIQYCRRVNRCIPWFSKRGKN